MRTEHPDINGGNVSLSPPTTIVPFGSVVLSCRRGMTSIRQLLTIAIIFALLYAFIVPPAILRSVERRANR